jgi:hypothetical protein
MDRIVGTRRDERSECVTFNVVATSIDVALQLVQEDLERMQSEWTMWMADPKPWERPPPGHVGTPDRLDHRLRSVVITKVAPMFALSADECEAVYSRVRQHVVVNGGISLDIFEVWLESSSKRS